MLIKNIEEKLEFYKSILKENEECFILVKHNNETTPLFVKRSEAAESGFFELNCVLFSYTYTKGNMSEEKFMKEQGYVVTDGYAYDIQTPFVFFEFDKYLGEFEKVSKKECVEFLRTH